MKTIQRLLLVLTLATGITPNNFCAARLFNSASFYNLATLCGAIGLGTYAFCKKIKPLQPPRYSIHLIWINRKLQDEQQYITPSSQEIDTALQWAQKNPESNVVVWFDSLVTTQQSVKNTQALITEKTSHEMQPIALKDIRSLATVQQHPTAFLPTLPVYFRADLARPVVATEAITADKTACCIYTDFDIAPLTKQELFDQHTLRNLKQHHFVMAQEATVLGFENSFQMFTYNERLLEATKTYLIDANIRMVEEFLTDMATDPFFKDNPAGKKAQTAALQENVFYSYPLMHAHLSQLNSTGKTSFNKNISATTEYAKVLMNSSGAFQHIRKMPIPTKQVNAPESTSLLKEISTPS